MFEFDCIWKMLSADCRLYVFGGLSFGGLSIDCYSVGGLSVGGLSDNRSYMFVDFKDFC